MAIEFHKGIDALKKLVESNGIEGSWSEYVNDRYSFRSQRKGMLNYWPGKGTVQCQGKPEPKAELEAIFASSERVADSLSGPSKKIFVVYGHDEAARSQLDSMLRRWGLEPVILDELPSKGQTIIEKLEDYTEDVGYSVVLATPDDMGHPKDKEDQKAFRVRQNVVLELGMLLAKLGRSRVAILLGSQSNMEKPSDIQGLIYIPFKGSLQKETGQTLAREMNAQGYDIKLKDL